MHFYTNILVIQKKSVLLPPEMIIKQIDHKPYVLCPWRRKYVKWTPEEQVRQSFLTYLVEQCGYTAAHIAVEVPLSNGQRADAIIYDDMLRPRMVIECKASDVPLTQQTLDQVAVYNRLLGAEYLVLHNGIRTIATRVSEQHFEFLEELPQV